MEANTLQKKKNSINKGKLKKTIKNVLCRPDPVFWPAISSEHGNQLEMTLNKYRVHIPEFKKPHWKEIQTLPKDERPKPPKIEKVEGLLLGLSECLDAVQRTQCSAIIIESAVNPRSIAQPVLETCVKNRIPAVCLSGLRKISATNFGIRTSFLGIKTDCLPDLKNKIIEIAKVYQPPKEKSVLEESKSENMDITVETKTENAMDTHNYVSCYLYRADKKTRVFIPPSEGKVSKDTKQFVGQNFIEFSEKSGNKNIYKKMMVKRISNNPNRAKVKSERN